MPLYFVTTTSVEEPDQTDFWAVLADSREEVISMMDDEYTKVAHIEDNFIDGLIDQYGGVALLTNP